MKTIKCCICNVNIKEKESHNPWPIRPNSSMGDKENRCCKNCNDILVIPARIACVCSTYEDMEDMEDFYEKLSDMNYEQLMNTINNVSF